MKKAVPIRYKKNVSLSNLNTFHLESIASRYIEIQNSKDLLTLLNSCLINHWTFRILAGGSNVVLPPEIREDLLIHIKGNQISVENDYMSVESGVLLANIVHVAIQNGWQGVEYLSGIPGTVGGAVVGNAGAYGRSISDVVDSVEIWDRGNVRVISKSDCMFSYRDSVFKKEPWIVLRINLKFGSGSRNKLKAVSEEITAQRKNKYKDDLKCPGSFFKNIVIQTLNPIQLKAIDQAKIISGKLPVGYLLESVGAKGMRIGDIAVSDFHANLLINLGKGTYKDVSVLVDLLKQKVKKKFGIRLEEEIRYF